MALLLVAITGTYYLLRSWWFAKGSGSWTVLVRYNDYGEAMLEGLFFHVFALVVVMGIARELWEAFKA